MLILLYQETKATVDSIRFKETCCLISENSINHVTKLINNYENKCYKSTMWLTKFVDSQSQPARFVTSTIYTYDIILM